MLALLELVFGMLALLELREDMMLAIYSLSVGYKNIVLPTIFIPKMVMKMVMQIFNAFFVVSCIDAK